MLDKSSTLLVASGFGSVTCRPANFIVFLRKVTQKTKKKGTYHSKQDWARKRSPSKHSFTERSEVNVMRQKLCYI